MVGAKAHIYSAIFCLFVVLLFLISFQLRSEGGEHPEDVVPLLSTGNVRKGFVRWVVDGDTVILKGGEHVRYVGVDTPEKGEPFYNEAKRRNAELINRAGAELTLIVCAEEPRDKYGRTLAWVWAGAVPVNEVLLKEGLAKTLMIPPCGLKKKKDYTKFESEAKGRRIGIWGLKR